MFSTNDRIVLLKSLPSYNDGSVFVFEKVMKKLGIQLAEQKIQEDRFNYLLEKSEHENAVLERRLKDKTAEAAKLSKQLKQQQVRNRRHCLKNVRAYVGINFYHFRSNILKLNKNEISSKCNCWPKSAMQTVWVVKLKILRQQKENLWIALIGFSLTILKRCENESSDQRGNIIRFRSKPFSLFLLIYSELKLNALII